MSCKSTLYAVNSNSQVLALSDTINFGSIVRRFGCNCDLSGGNVIINGVGYYDIDTNFTYTAGAAGDVEIALYKDGTLIPGATVTKTVAANSTYSFSIPTIVRHTCCCESTITAILTGVTGTFTNAAILVEKI